jgi:hypothetical protein
VRNLKTTDLIQKLSASNTSVHVVRLGGIEILKVVGVAGLCILAAVSVLGLREDFFDSLNSIFFIFESLVLLAVGILASASALTLSIPGRESRKTFLLPLVTLAIWVGLTGYSFLKYGQSPLLFKFGFACLSDIVLASLPPSALLFFLIRRAAPLKRDKVGFLILLSGAAYAALGVQLTCIDDSPVHVLLWHLLPVVVVAGLGIFVGKRVLHKI